MKLGLEQLPQHLKKNLAATYFVSGDEPLLTQEAGDLIRQHAQTLGFSEREVLSIDGHFNWEHFLAATHTLSLFSEKRLIELRLLTSKPGVAGSKVLQAYAEKPMPDTLLIIHAPKLESKAWQSAWCKALDKSGVILQIWPVEAAQLPNWLIRRAQQRGLTLTPEAAKFLAEQVEGNLLAAAQEIEKLSLLQVSGTLDIQTILDAVTDNAHFDIFNLTETVLLGDAKRGIRILRSLKAEGIEPPIILWALTRELRMIADMSQQYAAGANLAAIFSKFYIWEKRKPALTACLRRLSVTHCWKLLRKAATIDRMIKGATPGNVWDSLAALSLEMAI